MPSSHNPSFCPEFNSGQNDGKGILGMFVIRSAAKDLKRIK